MSEIDALQACLAAEHAACYGYGVLGGVLGGLAPGLADDLRATSSYDAHRRRRDELTALIRDQGSEPVEAEPAYETPFDVKTVPGCRRFARFIESRCAATYAYAVSQTADTTRQMAADELAACAVRSIEWGARLRAFPGIVSTP
jgi:hypothetical protein